MMYWLIDILEKLGFTAAICASAYLAYNKEYDSATLFAVWTIILLILIINNDDGEDGYYV